MPKDLYRILGLQSGASIEEVKKAYRTLSKELHPDKRKGDKHAEERFKEVNEAYEVLSNPKKKQMYDQFGVTDSQGGMPFGEAGFSPFGGAGFEGFSDIFESFFGGVVGRERGRARGRGNDRETRVEIDLEEVLHGGKRTISFRRVSPCAVCRGEGGEPGSKKAKCSTCGGTGQVTRSTQSFFGVIAQSTLCHHCEGEGEVLEAPCKMCGGEGRIARVEEVTVAIPPGIRDGQTLRVQGEGDAGRRGGKAGDLYVQVHVRSDPRFERDGDDLRSELHVSLPDAILGTKKEVTTIQGSFTLSIPEGTQPGQVFRLKGKGLPVLGTSRFGDHYVKVIVEVPRRLSRRERTLIEEWKKLME